ncbi:MAG: hypothetical protein HQL95_09620 [Magnetococcales bacterium]|nr:hypothetical protein [Magnetococcales bacterium]
MTRVTPAALEAEWTGNFTHRKRRTMKELTDTLIRELAQGPDETWYALFDLKPHQLLKRRDSLRHHAPMLAFAWRQAVLYSHPARSEPFSALLRQLAPALPGMNRQRLELFFNDLTFFQVITDNFAEDGFLSVGLHVVLRIRGEIETRPENLELAVAVSQWVEERFQSYREMLDLAEVVTG